MVIAVSHLTTSYLQVRCKQQQCTEASRSQVSSKATQSTLLPQSELNAAELKLASQSCHHFQQAKKIIYATANAALEFARGHR